MRSIHSFSIMLSRSTCILLTMLALVSHNIQTRGEEAVISLNTGNINNILSTREIVLVNFYADWCRFSQILTPVFEQTAVKLKEMFPDRVALAKVDCDKETGISSQYHISKYPTLKMFRNGQVVKKEYRGQRSPDAMTQYISSQIQDTIQRHESLAEIHELEENKRNVIGYFTDEETDSYKTFRRLSNQLRDDCKFHAAIGEVSLSERESGEKIMFRPPMTRKSDQVYTGDMHNFDSLLQWAQDKCMPLIREITFENAEELTEEGLPFLILFHKLEDTEIVETFNRVVTNQILGQKTSVNFLTADGNKFSHPLHHLGKTVNDLPILAIDSFRHMYLFKHDVSKDLEKDGLLQQFVDDLHSGKLHREFHHGADPEQPASQPGPDVPPTIIIYADGFGPDDVDDASPDAGDATDQPSSQPPESTFKKLKPSENRYTLLTNKDEL